MKVNRLYENYTIDSISKVIKDYQDFMKSVKPFVVEEYNNLASDKDYYPDFGDKPYKMDERDLVLSYCSIDSNEFVFTIEVYDNDGGLSNTFYISISYGDMEDILLNLTAKNYNL